MTRLMWLLVALASESGCRGATSNPVPLPELRIVSYNIRHGRGMDDRVDLARTGGVLARLTPDIVGLQEVDESVTRSGSVDEAAELGRALGMQHRFGAFMDYQRGRYGLAILSRFPVVGSRSIRLPDGNEPRVALHVDVTLPSGDTLSVVNVHFDWVASDSFRYPQAERLARALDSLPHPYILLGDFNDEPASRTLSLFRARARELPKRAGANLTFSSTEPVKEIDYVFAAPSRQWERGNAAAVDEPLASDHRPVQARVVLRPKM